MRGGVAAAVAFTALLVSAPQAGASSRPIAPGLSMTMAASPHAAGGNAVRLTVTLRYEMQCGYPGVGPLVVTFPSAFKLPQRFAPRTVKLDKKPVAAKVEGQRVTVRIPPHKGVLCNLMGPGSVTLAFTPAAKLANPAHPGSYRFKATHGKRTFTAKLAIEPAG
jgi:hypothetical protein